MIFDDNSHEEECLLSFEIQTIEQINISSLIVLTSFTISLNRLKTIEKTIRVLSQIRIRIMITDNSFRRNLGLKNRTIIQITHLSNRNINQKKIVKLLEILKILRNMQN